MSEQRGGTVATLLASDRVTGAASGAAKVTITGSPAVDVRATGGAVVSGPMSGSPDAAPE